jgi:hypothetical protein
MRQIDLNGHDVWVGTEREAEQFHVTDFLRLSKGENKYTTICILQRVSKGDLVDMAGIDRGKIDFAVPISFLKRDGIYVRDSNEWVWDYRGGSIGGKPLAVSAIITMVLEQVMDKITDNWIVDRDFVRDFTSMLKGE